MPSSYYTPQTLRLRTKNGPPQFPVHIFKAKQSIDSYENVFGRKTHNKPSTVSEGPPLEKFEMEKRNWRIYLTLPGHFLNIHLGHGAADHSFKIMLSDPEGQTTPPSLPPPPPVRSPFYKDEKPPEGS